LFSRSSRFRGPQPICNHTGVPAETTPIFTDLLLLTPAGRVHSRHRGVLLAGTSAQQLQDAANAVSGCNAWLLHDGGAAMGRRDFPARFELLDCSENLDLGDLAPALMHARPWQQPGWRAEALEWMTDQLGSPLSGAAWVHTFDVGAVFTAQVGEQHVYLKAGEHRREARVAVQISAQQPDLTPTVLAADPERGWLLTLDAGQCLLESASLPDWPSAVQTLAQVHRTIKLAAVPRHDFGALPEQTESLLSANVLMAWGMSDETQQRLRALLPELRRIHRSIDALGLPECSCHGDVHANNVLVQSGGAGGRQVRLFDWSEAALAHPLTDIGWFLAFVMHPARRELPLRLAHPDLGDLFWTTYKAALGIETGLDWEEVALLALFHRAVVYDVRFRTWVGTLPGFRPNYVPYFLNMALRFGAASQS
jgi:Phosphotransferase enzyme family